MKRGLHKLFFIPSSQIYVKSMNELAKSTNFMNINNSYRSDEISVSLSKNITKGSEIKNTKLTFLKRFENLILSSYNENKISTTLKAVYTASI